MIKLFRNIRYNLMETGKTGKYLKYAIGEIILVVIGILIALQIGNLNDQRKKDKQREIQKQLLKVELENDLEYLKSDLLYLENSLKIYSSYAERISKNSATLDTLKKIVRYEFKGTYNSIKKLNKTTFNSLESSGTMELLGNKLSNEVQQFYTNRDGTEKIIENNTQIYFNLLEPFIFKYPIEGLYSKGPLQDLYWESADLTTLYANFSSVLKLRIFSMNVRKSLEEQLIDETKALISHLDETTHK